MDPLPLIPENSKNHDVSSILCEEFQESLKDLPFPENIAVNFAKHKTNGDFSLLPASENVIQFNKTLKEEQENMNEVEYDIMVTHGAFLVKEESILEDEALKEHLRLKRGTLFDTIPEKHVKTYALLENSDILPNKIEQSIDFLYNKSLHLCSKCDVHMEVNCQQNNLEVHPVNKLKSKTETEELLQGYQPRLEKKSPVKTFVAEPDVVEFCEYEQGMRYTVKFGIPTDRKTRLRNISCALQTIRIDSRPKTRCFLVELSSNVFKIAPGMCMIVTVHFLAEVNKNIVDKVLFRSSAGDITTVYLKATRKAPKLICYIFKSLEALENSPTPDTDGYDENRQEALNNTLDCGSCLVYDYVMLSLIMENKGSSGHFFIITEDEWCMENINKITSSLELKKDGFWLHPIYFEIQNGETVEINIIFLPKQTGLHNERLYIICNNNAHEEIEIIGDACYFSKKMIAIDILPRRNIQEWSQHRIFLGHREANVPFIVTATVHNKSSVRMKYYWVLSSEDESKSTVKPLELDYVHVNEIRGELCAYLTKDFDIEIFPKVETTGYYNFILSFFIADIPIASLEENSEFVVSLVQRHDCCKFSGQFVDVRVAEIEIAAYIVVKVPEDTAQDVCECIEPKIYKPKLKFCTPLLDLGLIAKGVDIQRKFYVENLSNDEVSWTIVEVKYDVDNPPYMEIIHLGNRSSFSGVFTYKGEYKIISYKIITTSATRWVSFLLLIRPTNDPTILTVDDSCLITYQVIEYDITVSTGYQDLPILCPLKLLYVKIQERLEFTMCNNSLLPGCFYFLKPKGEDADKFVIEIKPQAGVLLPRKKVNFILKLTALDIGIFENVYIPCFVGKRHKLIIFRLLCAVDNVHVFFYLPKERNDFTRILWPPKIVHEYEDEDWDYGMRESTCTLDFCKVFKKNPQEDEREIVHGDDEVVYDDLSTVPTHETDDYQSAQTYTVNDMHAMNKTDTEITESSQYSLMLPEYPLANSLCEHFQSNDVILQPNIVEIPRVPLRTPTKFSFYLENITPRSTTFTVESTNYAIEDHNPKRDLDNILVECKMKSVHDIWDHPCNKHYGIVVEPETPERKCSSFELLEINIWIYANTWGIYLEEIVIDINDIPSFCFSLIIEVIGAPLEFPIALNTIRKYPTIRFGSIPYLSEQLSRSIKIVNISAVPIYVIWHVFLIDSNFNDARLPFNILFEMFDDEVEESFPKLILTDEFFGDENIDFITVHPKEMTLQGKSSLYLDIVLEPSYFSAKSDKTEINCCIVGYFYVTKKDKCKLNYFYRKTGEELQPLRLNVLATFEMPRFKLDMICGETEIEAYANDVIFEEIGELSTRLLFQNNEVIPILTTMHIDAPFEILCMRTQEMENKSHVRVNPRQCLEVFIKCNLTAEKLLEYAYLVYEDVKTKEIVNKSDKILRIRRNLNIHQKGIAEQTVPLDLVIHYPHIMIKPYFAKMGYVLIGCTKKTSFSLYNLTGAEVKFEIYKSCNNEDIVVYPHYGTIKKSSCQHKEFVDIFVYFTPKACEMYQETIRIITNIPIYHVDFHIRGYGSFNEKFDSQNLQTRFVLN